MNNSEFQPYVEFSEGADAVYVYFSDERSHRTQMLDDRRMIDWAADGRLVGVEFLDVSAGVNLHDMPERERVEALIRGLGLPVLV